MTHRLRRKRIPRRARAHAVVSAIASPQAVAPDVCEAEAVRCACGQVIAARFKFDTCTRCALRQLRRDPDVLAWREAKRQQSLERISAMLAKRARVEVVQ